MKVVGLTGGIGSGKSTVAERLTGHGVVVIDADDIARAVVVPGSPVLAALAEEFGDEIVLDDGTLDRARLARLAFASTDAKRRLEAITHPAIDDGLESALAAVRQAGVEPVVVIDHPLLIETGRTEALDGLIVVIAPADVRRRRLLVERGMDAEDVEARMRAQTDDTTRRRAADWVIDNDGDLEALYRRTDEVHDAMMRWASADRAGAD